MEHLILGDLRYRVRWSPRRKTLGLTVERDGSLTLAAPPGCPEARLEAFARARRFWVYTQLAKRDLLEGPALEKEFVSGEGFTYLGRSYRLKVVPSRAGEPLRLTGGRFELDQSIQPQAVAVFQAWYRRNGKAWLTRRIQLLAPRVGVEPSGVQVQDLGFRWASAGRNGQLYFHWKVMTLQPSLVEYIVVHELVHLRVPHHTPAFWRAVGRVLPDFQVRKAALALLKGGL